MTDEDWVPKTQLGKLVAEGKIKTMSEAIRSRLPLKEYQIVDILLPNLMDEAIYIERAQRMTDSGRRMNYSVTAVVGNGDGFVGVGRGKAKEAAPAIRKAVNNAKLNILEIRRGCGSWECGCGRAHTLPFLVVGKSGSVEVVLKPAPQGLGRQSEMWPRSYSGWQASRTLGLRQGPHEDHCELRSGHI